MIPDMEPLPGIDLEALGAWLQREDRPPTTAGARAQQRDDMAREYRVMSVVAVAVTAVPSFRRVAGLAGTLL